MIKSILGYINGLVAGGLIVQNYYIWFLLPAFKQMPQISYLEAVGLSAFLYLFNRLQAVDLVLHKKYEEDNMVKYGSFLLPWIVLLFGFTTHLIIDFLK